MLRGHAAPRSQPQPHPSSRVAEINDMHRHYAEAHESSGTNAHSRESTMTFDLSKVSTAYEPQTGLDPSPTLSSSYLQHKRQQSAPAFSLPRMSSKSSPSCSPTRTHHTRQGSRDMPLTGDGRSGRLQSQNTPGRLAGWFNSTTAPPVDEKAFTDTTPTPKSAPPSRFSFFTSMSAFTGRKPSASPEELDEELCNLDIEAALYPANASSPADRDGFSPAAYKNLQTNATGLLLRMQAAYRERAATVRELLAEREAHREEMEETNLRLQLFKTQLEDMAQKAAEHEEEMQRLVMELDAEKRARHEQQQQQQQRRSLLPSPAVPSEDLGVDDAEEEERRRRWRNSRGTVRSDLSLETDAESNSESVSVFSRSRSPTTTTSATIEAAEGGNAAADLLPPPPIAVAAAPYQQEKPLPAPPASGTAAAAAANATLAPPKQLSAFQKLVKGISGGDQAESPDGSCRNCRGRGSSAAWDTVSHLRDENKGLKQRVAQLEVAVEGALDAVKGIGL
ncbi:hypothetical protein DL766_001465 [Monosporascus sp. MC13-8B]|uniref:GDP/GTP exchange factor Sec2 N-terminal domain-containing protein n=1 Tax=Monosporascus cannonballus TaxID=155416 RepID=A0ABY0GT38_9PEZI|nr:hypothetical protein DL762_009838 [Monosporascus cannonballus]RYP37585.1 hypothetical protein DL766_001465 [Monosporascus sp. MC13-8B]